MTTTILSHSELATLVTNLVGSGTSVIAPVPAGKDWEWTEYRAIQRLEEAALGGSLPRRPLREFFRPSPRVPTPHAPQVILGARPCDAAGVEALDDVMAWDCEDEWWFASREATTIVSLACAGVDGSCFCSAVGVGPDSTRGSDVLLVPLAGSWGSPPSQLRIVALLRNAVDTFLVDSEPFPGAAELQASADEAGPQRQATALYLAEAVSPKGDALLKGRGKPPRSLAELHDADVFVRSARRRVAANAAVLWPPQELQRLHAGFEAQLGIAAADGGELIDPAPSLLATRLPEWLARNPDHALMRSISSRCRACGACEEVCSTSEGHEVAGTPARNVEGRVMHKFCVHPRRFDAVLCTGCGRCARVCEAGMKLPEILGQLVQLAAPPSGGRPVSL